MNNRQSESIIDNISFVDLQPLDISPFISACNIKVCYVGQNRNNSYINKETLTKMSKTLRGCPIVGWYSEDKKDFMDHGDQMIIDGDGVHFNNLTRPYGFIDINSKIWFQYFEDTDEFGNTCLREYLVVQGYLWTGQYPEASQAIKNKNPQSMELDEETLKGHWATDNNSGIEFFIINDAIFSKLCILGEDVEPCFEGAQITDPEINSIFSNNSNNNFIKSFITSVKELNYALKTNKGGLSMDVEKNTAPAAEESKEVVENSFQNQKENQNDLENYKKKDDEKDTQTSPTDTDEEKQNSKSDSDDSKKEEKKDTNNNNNNNNNNKDDDNEEEKKKPSTKNNLEDISKLQSALNELQEKFALLENENKELLAFKNQVEDEEKDKLIKSFYMLSDEDKRPVVENKAKYSLDEIKKELSVICFDKKVNFNLEENKEDDNNTAAAPTIFNMKTTQVDNLPAWLRAVENVKNRNN